MVSEVGEKSTECASMWMMFHYISLFKVNNFSPSLSSKHQCSLLRSTPFSISITLLYISQRKQNDSGDVNFIIFPSTNTLTVSTLPVHLLKQVHFLCCIVRWILPHRCQIRFPFSFPRSVLL